jgi:hypothetical protein
LMILAPASYKSLLQYGAATACSRETTNVPDNACSIISMII